MAVKAGMAERSATRNKARVIRRGIEETAINFGSKELAIVLGSEYSVCVCVCVFVAVASKKKK